MRACVCHFFCGNYAAKLRKSHFFAKLFCYFKKKALLLQRILEKRTKSS